MKLLLVNLVEVLCLIVLHIWKIFLQAGGEIPFSSLLAVVPTLGLLGLILVLSPNRKPWYWLKLVFVIVINIVSLGEAFYSKMYGEPLNPPDFWFLLTTIHQWILGAGSELDGVAWGIIGLAIFPIIIFFTAGILNWPSHSTPTLGPIEKGKGLLQMGLFFLLMSFFCWLGKDNLLAGKILHESIFGRNYLALSKIDAQKAQAFYQNYGPKLLYGRPGKKNSFTLNLLGSNHQRKNIILVMLESIGSDQLFKDHKVNSQVAPYLANFPGRMKILDQVYIPGPATVYSHFELFLGRGNSTWESLPSVIQEQKFSSSLAHQMKEAGYHNALFSAATLDFADLVTFYKKLPFAHFQYPEKMPPSLVKKYRLNYWGIDELPIIEEAVQWMAGQKNPTFVTLLTSSAHAPYNQPKNFQRFFPEDSNLNRYKNSIRFIDYCLKNLFEHLTAKGLGDKTIVILIGDHGEGFRLWHQNDYGHGAHLYETTIKSYATFLELNRQRELVVDSRIVNLQKLGFWLGDSMVGSKVLESKNLEEGIVFFKSRNEVPMIGLRDGRWKFKMQLGITKSPYLFDLQTDPHELKNLVGNHPNMLANYQQLALGWYLSELQNNSKSFPSLFGENASHILGPKHIKCGVFFQKKFQHQEIIHPTDSLMCRIYSIGYAERGKMQLVWSGPNNFSKKVFIIKDRNWQVIDQFLNSDAPLNEGKWKIAIYQEQNQLASGFFTVTNKTSVFQSRFPGVPSQK